MNIHLSSWMLLALLFLAACSKQDHEHSQSDSTAETSFPVKVETVQLSKKALPLRSTGILASQAEIRLGFKIGGIIQAIYVEEGMSVRKGQQLARLNPVEINAQFSQAKSAVAKSKRDLARVQQLYADSVATLEQVQDLTTALEMAKASLESASFNQAHAVIYAPASGQVLKRFGEKGEVVGPGTPILLLSNTGKNQVLRTGLSDVEVVQLSLGDEAKVQFDALPNENFSARVSQIAAGSDPRTGTFEVELQLRTTNKHLKNGFVGKATILPSNQLAYVQLPIEALVEADADRAVIYVPDSSFETAQRVELTRYDIRDESLAIPATELLPNTPVITEGAKYLEPGASIRIVEDKSFATAIE
ncbi:MAG: efflux RND transporter periplasmic adaptor subunit [Bacteroidota bacterium]